MYWKELELVEALCYSEIVMKSVAGIRLVKTENPSACVTANCGVCRPARAL
jgi:hypothetical protein